MNKMKLPGNTTYNEDGSITVDVIEIMFMQIPSTTQLEMSSECEECDNDRDDSWNYEDE